MFQIRLLDGLFLGSILASKCCRRVVVRVGLIADIPVLGGVSTQQIHEQISREDRPGCSVEVGDSRLEQEESALVPQHNAVAARAILVFLELQLAQIIVGLFAGTGTSRPSGTAGTGKPHAMPLTPRDRNRS
jgi:hypothetical protein